MGENHVHPVILSESSLYTSLYLRMRVLGKSVRAEAS